MSQYKCCNIDMMVAPSVAPDGTPRITRLCLICEVRLIDVPEQRTSTESEQNSQARYLSYRQGVALQRPWIRPVDGSAEPFASAGRFVQAG
jgi:hypothetical protein